MPEKPFKNRMCDNSLQKMSNIHSEENRPIYATVKYTYQSKMKSQVKFHLKQNSTRLKW